MINNLWRNIFNHIIVQFTRLDIFLYGLNRVCMVFPKIYCSCSYWPEILKRGENTLVIAYNIWMVKRWYSELFLTSHPYSDYALN